MLQVYPFHGQDVQEVYETLNSFLQELAAIDVIVPLENVRSNTKTYPDYGTTATTIEVALYLNDKSDIVSQIHDLHQAVVYSAKPAQEKTETSDFDPFLDSSEENPRFHVDHVRIKPDDRSDLFELGITTAGPDEDLTVIFPDGTQRRSDGAYVFLGGSVAYVEGNEVILAVRTW